jgi:hypothetical protein
VAINGSVAPSVFNLPVSVGLQNAERINQFKAGVNWKFLPNFL